jgi:L-ascorbate metabolism protein UlaG (beta-lactamase superfamily)
MTDLLKWQLSSNPWKAEKKLERPISPDFEGIDAFKRSTAEIRVLWMGHASFLVGIGDQNVLFDPVYGKLGPFISRWSDEPFPLSELPPIDAVFLSHGHYDHLDKETLDAVARANPRADFFVPLGQDSNLPRSCAHIHTFDWWDCARWNGLELTFLPTQHWHRRGLRDYNKALWGGWRVGERVFHCGDSGYCDVFALLGKLFTFDVAMMPVGAFEPRWFMKTQHMNPAESLRAFQELGAERFVAMHWGTYDLTDEPLNLGGERIVALAAEEGVSSSVFVPAIGGLLEFS